MTITLTVDVSDISDGQQIDAADVITPVNQLKVHLENVLNGVQKFEQLLLGAPVELTIATGAVTVTRSNHFIDTESDAASDNLDTASGMADGDLAIIRAANTARTVVVTDGIGNIQTRSGLSINLDTTEKMCLLWGRASDVLAVELGGGSVPANGVRLINDAAQDLVTATNTILDWATEIYDDGGFHDASPDTEIVFPVDGVYIVVASIFWESNATGDREISLVNNTTPFDIWAAQNNPAIVGNDAQSICIVQKFSAGDTLVVKAEQSSGGNLEVLHTGATDSYFTAELLRVT